MTINEMREILMNQYLNKEITIGELTDALKALGSINDGGNSGTNSGKGTVKYSTNIKDYEPKKDKDGNYNYRSHGVNRKKYCYAVATNGLAVEFTKAVDIDFDGVYANAKAEFNKVYPYVAKDKR